MKFDCNYFVAKKKLLVPTLVHGREVMAYVYLTHGPLKHACMVMTDEAL